MCDALVSGCLEDVELATGQCLWVEVEMVGYISRLIKYKRRFFFKLRMSSNPFVNDT